MMCPRETEGVAADLIVCQRYRVGGDHRGAFADFTRRMSDYATHSGGTLEGSYLGRHAACDDAEGKAVEAMLLFRFSDDAGLIEFWRRLEGDASLIEQEQEFSRDALSEMSGLVFHDLQRPRRRQSDAHPPFHTLRYH